MPCELATIQSETCDSGIGRLNNPVQLLQIIAQILCDVSSASGGGGSGQIKYYTSDPNSEAVEPDDTSLPAIAYSLDGSGSIYGWNPNTLLWV